MNRVTGPLAAAGAALALAACGGSGSGSHHTVKSALAPHAGGGRYRPRRPRTALPPTSRSRRPGGQRPFVGQDHRLHRLQSRRRRILVPELRLHRGHRSRFPRDARAVRRSGVRGHPSDVARSLPGAASWPIGREDMFGGHCFGFAIMSLRLFRHQLARSVRCRHDLRPVLKGAAVRDVADCVTQVLPPVPTRPARHAVADDRLLEAAFPKANPTASPTRWRSAVSPPGRT